MAENDHLAAVSHNGMLDAKTLLLGLTSVIGILGGGFGSYWIHQNDLAVESNKRSNDAQWERIRANNDQILTFNQRLEAMERSGQDREERLRALERESYRRQH